MSAPIFVYVVITVCLAGMAAVIASEPLAYPSDRKTAARFALAAPVWPLLLLVWLVLGVRNVWKTADLGGGK